jgi:hypothetical protein
MFLSPLLTGASFFVKVIPHSILIFFYRHLDVESFYRVDLGKISEITYQLASIYDAQYPIVGFVLIPSIT